jgi:glycine/D-amino acid oxidase-like deaminating enzyme
VADLGLDCQFECTGIIDLAIEEHQGQWLHEESTDENTVCLDATAVQAAVASSTNLAGVRFRHKWAGAIDTSTWFCAFFGQARGGRISYAAGFTGLGGGAEHFAARVVLDQLAGRTTERTELAMVRGVHFRFRRADRIRWNSGHPVGAQPRRPQPGKT